MRFQDIIAFWFEETPKEKWFVSDPKFDEVVKTKFSDVHRKAVAGELFEWRKDELGRLAEIIVIDQFSRNMFRNTAQMFAYDNMCLILSQQAVADQADKNLTAPQKAFLYMPFMHSESKVIHEHAVKLFDQKGLEENLKFEMLHKKIIDRFGRFPHRNKILGRASTPEEIDFLKEPGSSF